VAGIKRVGVVGGGVIGAGWAARFALAGTAVTVFDPDPEAERRVREVLAVAERAWRRLTLAPLAPPAPVAVTGDLEAAVTAADFVQEAAPDREDHKRDLLARVSRSARPEVVIASSSATLPPSRLQEDMAGPERFVVGHPLDPVYLLPLVELCGGARTAPETIERAEAVYRAIGMHPLHVRGEIDGLIAERLLAAVRREALQLVSDGSAIADEIDQAIAFGPGLCWSFMGTAQPDGPGIGEARRQRDDCLVAVLQALRSQGTAAGATLHAFDQRLFQGSHRRLLAEGDDLARPLCLHEARVLPEWVDYNGHMTESRYLQVFGDSTDAVLRYLGADAAYNASGFSFYTVETHIRHLREVEAGAPLRVTTQVLAADARRLHLFHAMARGDDGNPLATGEHLLLHVDTRAARACPAEGEMATRLLRLAAAQAALPRPEAAGRAVGQPPGRQNTAAT
jgi:carnitine 3-dehydrogenase